MLPAMKVLVTGGTGFVGRAVVAALAREGHQPMLLARRPETPAVRRLAAATGAMVFAGDVVEPDTLTDAFAGAEAVVHLVGIIGECGPATFDRVHRTGTENALAAAREASGIRRFIHMSALGTRPRAASRYHQTKWAAEEAVRASGLDWTVFRPSVIFGPGDQFLNLFARMSRWTPVLPLMGSGQGRLQPVAVEDVATAFARALTAPRAVGQVFDLCGPGTLPPGQGLHALLAARAPRCSSRVLEPDARRAGRSCPRGLELVRQPADGERPHRDGVLADAFHRGV